MEGKNGSIVRKQMGYGWIARSEAEKIQAFYRQTLNVYLNYHRPCGYATEVVDRNGKIRKRYDSYLTPYEKFSSLSHPQQYLRRGVTMTELKRIAQAHSDTEYARLVKRAKADLCAYTVRDAGKQTTWTPAMIISYNTAHARIDIPR